ncbi:sensor domain-containing diguanylate cyclase [Paenibacillus gansuensis]|uniref:Diguanylate cyclase domain-containing protein n=1 Tax=Paenibacillus gansuensis TaxID=306542 RepID=A0ABW5P821_9BACL
MAISLSELGMYRNFDEMADDVLQMANEVMQDKLVYISALTAAQQIILKVLENHNGSIIPEGLAINREQTVCNRIDFEHNAPLIFEDISKESCLEPMRELLKGANINSYIGVPIILTNGDVFGTLCAVHPAAAKFDSSEIAMFRRIAKMFAYYLELERLAYRDALTGLYNRQYLVQTFPETSDRGGSLFFLDMDGFKNVNDQLGHDAGDEVLKDVAGRLTKYMETHKGYAVRLGGDEFIVNFPELLDPQEIEQHAKAILERLSAWDEKFLLTVSMGIVTYTSLDANKLNELLKQADTALYQAKAKGKNTFQWYVSERVQ